MGGSDRPVDRRVHTRMDIGATAVIYRKGAPVGSYVVDNVSPKGALLRGEVEVEPGRPVRVQLSFAGGTAVGIAGSVKRVDRSDGMVSLAVEFPALSAQEVDAIQRALATAERRSMRPRPPGVLLFEKRTDVRELLEREIAALGRRTRWVTTPLDAIQVISDPEEQIEAVIIDAAIGETLGAELVEFFAQQRGLRTIVLEGPDNDPDTMARFSSFAHAFLPLGWDRWRLERVLA